jgi:hypothetical protein
LGQRPRTACRPELHLGTGGSRGRAELGQCLRETASLEGSGSQVEDRSPGLAEALSRHLERLVHRGPRALEIGAALEQCLSGLEMKCRRRQPLGQRVVDLPGDTVPLLDCTRLQAALYEPGALDRDAEHVADGAKDPQLIR